MLHTRFMSPIPILLAVLVLLVYWNQAKRRTTRRMMRFEWAKPCEDEPQNSLSCYDVQLRMQRTGEVTVDADCFVSRRAENWRRMDVNMTKCNEVVTAQSCEYFTTWSYKADVCSVITMPNMPWTVFTSTVQPPVRCPFKPGNYSCRDAKLDAQKLAQFPFPFDNNVFIFKLSLFTPDDKLHSCMTFAFRIYRLRA